MMLLTLLQKLLLFTTIGIQTLMCLLLIFLILLQKGDDGGIGQVFMRTSILYNKSENIFIRKVIVFIATFVITGCLLLSLYFYRVNQSKYAIENIIGKY
jgi:protein translocase SecG subunit